MSERDLDEAVRLQGIAERALRDGDYADAAMYFEHAATVAWTDLGAACLLSKAVEARALITCERSGHAH